MSPKIWKPDQKTVKNTHIYRNMRELGFNNYKDFYHWSVDNKEAFWGKTLQNLHIPFATPPQKILDTTNGNTDAKWLPGAKLNIVDACFTHNPDAIAIYYQEENGDLQQYSYGALKLYVNRIANALYRAGLQKKDVIAIDMPMTLEAVAIYLAGIKAGMQVATIADSFTPEEIKARLDITHPKLVFTQDVQLRAGKKLDLYQKVVRAQAPKIVVIPAAGSVTIPLRHEDVLWDDFLVDNTHFESVICPADDTTTILFSSGTTGAPKAIPWTHITPLKSASDGYYHHDIHPDEVVAWPTNLGWMMGPWLVFASLINRASMALYYGAPMGKDFGAFVEKAKINMLGLVPSIVKNWIATGDMEAFDWRAIKCFSSTGEASNPQEYAYLMALAGEKPVLEYCGGTEIGGGYVCSTLVQDNIPSTFSTQALGGSFVLLDEQNRVSDKGEVFIIPPVLGLSNRLLNRDHYEVYYKNTPRFNGQKLRRHGDRFLQLENGYYKAQGRVDDAMNLGGIKVSSLQIEAVVNTLDFVKESAAVAVSPRGGGPDKLILYYVPLRDINPDNALQQIRHQIKTKLNPLFKASGAIALQKLPRTASGKVMRRKLREEAEK